VLIVALAAIISLAMPSGSPSSRSGRAFVSAAASEAARPDRFSSSALAKKARIGGSQDDDGQNTTHHEDNEYRSIQKSLSGFDRAFNDVIAFFVHGRLLSQGNRPNGIKVPNHRQGQTLLPAPPGDYRPQQG
jgi:hypothetical protein